MEVAMRIVWMSIFCSNSHYPHQETFLVIELRLVQKKKMFSCSAQPMSIGGQSGECKRSVSLLHMIYFIVYCVL